MALLGFLDEVEESAHVASVILDSSLPHRAAPHVRNAFEAAQHALILATEEDYPLAGARVWVYYYRRDSEIIERDGKHERASDWYERKLAEMTTLWNQFCAGQGRLIEEARELVDKQPRRPDNWCGFAPAKELAARYEIIAKALGGSPPAGVSEATNGAFAALSRGTHPRIPNPAAVVRRGDGTIELLPEQRDDDGARQSVSAGLSSAVMEAMLAAVYRAANAS